MPARAGGAGRFALARLLLRVLQTVRQLDRKLILLFATSLLPACIIPVGPEFQDPPGVANSPPQILNPVPDWGLDTTGTSVDGAGFSITVTDLNGDDLHIRWIVDFQKKAGPDLVGHDNPNKTVEKQVTCQQDIDDAHKTNSRHPVRVVVADRKFLDNTDDLLAVEAPGVYTVATWTLIMTCPVSPQ